MDGIASKISTWFSALDPAEPRTQGIMLLAGLGMLALALMVVMLTRWGQAKPLSKCIGLSVFAHFLLMIYAYSADLWAETPPTPERYINVSITSLEDDSDSQASEREDKPWEQFPTESVVPDVEKPERQEETEIFDQQREQPLPTVPPAAIAMADNLPVFEPSRETIKPPPIVTEPPTTAAAPMKIEMPRAERQQAPTPSQPEVPEPERVEVRVTDQTPGRLRVGDSAVPLKSINDADTLQQLADVTPNALAGESLAADSDRLNSANNSSDDHQQAPSVGGGMVPIPVPPVAASPPPPTRAVGPAMISVRPGDGSQLPSVYQSRADQNRAQLIQQYGGNAQTEAAVQAALKWLAAYQHPDGRWDAGATGGGREAGEILGHQRGGAGADADTGITGLALLTFLAAGQSHYEGVYRQNIQRGLEFLLRSQKASGNMAGDARFFARMYCHGIATLAISEAYAVTGDHRMKAFVERAIGYTVRSQNQADGGWRYAPGDQGDMSQLGWQLMALKSAELAGIRTPPATRAGMIRFLNSVATGRNRGLASYRRYSAPTRTMTAEAMICRVFLNLDQSEAAIDEAARFVLQDTPGGRETNLYYWYYATLALFQLQDQRWQSWNERLQAELLSTQNKSGQLAGSWEPNTTWGGYGGRVYSTAMATLCLEVYYRYLPIFEK